MTPEEIAARMDGQIEEVGPGAPRRFCRRRSCTTTPRSCSGCRTARSPAPGSPARSREARHLHPPRHARARARRLEPGGPGLGRSGALGAEPGDLRRPRERRRRAVPHRPARRGVRRSARSLPPLEPRPTASRRPGRTLGLPLGSFVRAPAVVRDDGAWMLPLFLCKELPGARWTGSHDIAAVAVSTDRGATWSLVEVPESTGCVHMTIVPLAARAWPPSSAGARPTSSTGPRARTAVAAGRRPSRPTCRTTTRRSPRSACATGGSRCSATRSPRRSLRAPRLALRRARRGGRRPRDPTGGVAAIWGVPRAPLTLCLSEDGGRTFPLRRVVEDGPGTCLSNNALDGHNQELSYPAMVEGRTAAFTSPTPSTGARSSTSGSRPNGSTVGNRSADAKLPFQAPAERAAFVRRCEFDAAVRARADDANGARLRQRAAHRSDFGVMSARNRLSVLQDAYLVLGQGAEGGLKGAPITPWGSLTLLDGENHAPSPSIVGERQAISDCASPIRSQILEGSRLLRQVRWPPCALLQHAPVA